MNVAPGGVHSEGPAEVPSGQAAATVQMIDLSSASFPSNSGTCYPTEFVPILTEQGDLIWEEVPLANNLML